MLRIVHFRHPMHNHTLFQHTLFEQKKKAHTVCKPLYRALRPMTFTNNQGRVHLKDKGQNFPLGTNLFRRTQSEDSSSFFSCKQLHREDSSTWAVTPIGQILSFFCMVLDTVSRRILFPFFLAHSGRIQW